MIQGSTAILSVLLGIYHYTQKGGSCFSTFPLSFPKISPNFVFYILRYHKNNTLFNFHGGPQYEWQKKEYVTNISKGFFCLNRESCKLTRFWGLFSLRRWWELNVDFQHPWMHAQSLGLLMSRSAKQVFYFLYFDSKCLKANSCFLGRQCILLDTEQHFFFPSSISGKHSRLHPNFRVEFDPGGISYWFCFAF